MAHAASLRPSCAVSLANSASFSSMAVRLSGALSTDPLFLGQSIPRPGTEAGTLYRHRARPLRVRSQSGIPPASVAPLRLAWACGCMCAKVHLKHAPGAVVVVTPSCTPSSFRWTPVRGARTRTSYLSCSHEQGPEHMLCVIAGAIPRALRGVRTGMRQS
ncbi:hypothetical protein GY45DRAFT_605782 [Cubamyces sp. BRFM 1775]|nr:hypothetical protein GY45DRAFT_605782 [Cubamyces sp. BRFM 1775]